jgi:hypothetical protein
VLSTLLRILSARREVLVLRFHVEGFVTEPAPKARSATGGSLLDGAFESGGCVWRKLDFDRASTEFMCHKECRLGHR